VTKVYSDLRSRLTPAGRRRKLRWQERLLLYLILAICVTTVTVTLLIWKSRTVDPLEWSDVTQLPEAKAPPACVSSESDPADPTYIEPFICRGNSEYALEKIHQILRQDSGYRYVRLDEFQVQAVAVTPLLGFHDDLVFQRRSDPERIEVYSSSRVGIGDMGANRERLEELRELLRRIYVLK